MTRPNRHCPDCRGSGWRRGQPIRKTLEDGTVREYPNAVERCGCHALRSLSQARAGPGRERAAGEAQ